MSGYDTFDRPHHQRRSISNLSGEENPPPHLYATPVVSRGLITAFGRPTLIEYEVPSSVTTAHRAQAGRGEEFISIHRRPLSLPASDLAEIQRPQHRHTQSSFAARTKSRSGIFDETAHLSSAYTYRVRTFDSADDHHLVMCQNPDGTYSHTNADGDPLGPESRVSGIGALGRLSGLSAFGASAVSAVSGAFAADVSSEAGVMLSTQQQQQDLKASVSLDTMTHLEETITNLDSLPAYIHPPIPPEVLHPQFTQTAPALKMWPLAVLVFYNVSGGPFGIEPSIRAGGNYYAILGFLLFPFVWSIPEALVTAELGSAFQEPSAGVAWVEAAFGEFMGKMCGYLAWVAGATDNAIYPTLFLEYVTSTVGWDKDYFEGWTRFGLVAAITIVLSMINYTGLEIVGNASLLVCIIAMSPFVIMTIIGATKVVPSRWFQLPEANDVEYFTDDFQTGPGPMPLLGLANIVWRPFLNNMFWNLNKYDNAGSFSGETTDVRTTYPRGIFVGLVMVIVFYIFPLLVAVGATDYKQSEWVDGHLGAVAVDIGGNWLGAWIIFAAGISNLALFEAELSSDAFQLMGMADRGYLPKIFQKRSKYGTPTTGIIVGTIVIILFGCADFGRLLELLNANYSISLIMEYAAFVKLRIYNKDLERPYRIPIPDWAAVFVVIPPVLGITFIFAVSNWAVYFFTIGSLTFGVALFKMGEICKQNGWFTFEQRVRSNQYAMSPVDDGTDPTAESSIVTAGKEDTIQENGEWEYKNEELGVIQEENKLV